MSADRQMSASHAALYRLAVAPYCCWGWALPSRHFIFLLAGSPFWQQLGQLSYITSAILIALDDLAMAQTSV